MLRVAQLTGSVLTLIALVKSAPTHLNQLDARLLLGSSFGVPGSNQTFDYVVLGGGNAGLTIATRLAETATVAVIEAGSFYEIDNGNISQVPAFDSFFTGKDLDDFNPLIDWGFHTTPQAGALNEPLHYARGKCLGGSSARNYMTYQRGTIGSYKQWADLVGDESYTFRHFLPFFEKSLHFTPPDSTKRAQNSTPQYDMSTLGNGKGPLSLTFANYAQAFSSWAQKGLAEIGIHPTNGFTSGKLFGSSYTVNTIQASNMVRDSSETAFLQPALKNPNLYVFQSTLGKKIIFDANKRATGVQVDTDGKVYTLSANKEVILSAGAFQSPQLLMVSGVGPKATLAKHNIPLVADRPGVGQNMWDHVLFGPSYRVNVITASSLSNPAFAQQATEDYINKQEGILTNTGGDFLAWEKIPRKERASFSNGTLADLAKFPADWPEVEYLNVPAYFGFQRNFIRDAPTDGFQYASVLLGLVAPLSRGTVDISSADAADPPVINPNWLTHPADVAVAIAGYKRVRQLFATQAMKPVLIGQEYFPGANVTTDDEILQIIRQSFGSIFHASSTCAMGRTNDTAAVVDSKARVIGVQGLRVVDASAFPLLPPGHPMATVYALAEKIADEIKKANS